MPLQSAYEVKKIYGNDSKNKREQPQLAYFYPLMAANNMKNGISVRLLLRNIFVETFIPNSDEINFSIIQPGCEG